MSTTAAHEPEMLGIETIRVSSSGIVHSKAVHFGGARRATPITGWSSDTTSTSSSCSKAGGGGIELGAGSRAALRAAFSSAMVGSGSTEDPMPPLCLISARPTAVDRVDRDAQVFLSAIAERRLL